MSAPGGERTIDGLTMVLVIVCLGLLAGILVLGSQNVRLKKELGSHTVRSADQVDLAGVAFRSLNLRDGAGSSADLTFGENGAILLVFASDCPNCVATLPDWEELFSGEPDPDRLPVYGIQLDMPDQAGSQAGIAKELPFPVLGAADQASLGDLRRIPLIPAALHLDAGGRVVKAWIGRPGDGELGEMKALKTPK